MWSLPLPEEMTMARMLGKCTIENRQGGCWWWCCPGHDGTHRIYAKINRGGQRRRETRAWKREFGVA